MGVMSSYMKALACRYSSFFVFFNFFSQRLRACLNCFADTNRVKASSCPLRLSIAEWFPKEILAKVAFSEVVKDILRQDVCLGSSNLLGLKR